jgi:alkanesulfonate monooxygenase SsuD/methylene tetrahydromethanopterin reductase-like flavin-dependent oxidoreductase (luciferase family)
VKFGLFYELQLPRPWGPADEHQLFKHGLAEVELADRLGFDQVWAVEHHFLEEYSHSSAPELFLAACSQRTQRIRLGHGIVQLPKEINHTARVAERIATLDLLSDGRVDFGTGEASSVAELEGFGVDWSSKRAQWDDNLDAVTRMMVEEPFAGWDGPWLKMPPRNVVPKPMQKPHPPLWVACSQPSTIQLAATKGIGALSFAFVNPVEAERRVSAYYDALVSDACEPAGFAVNANVAIVLPLLCHEDEDVAVARGLEGAKFFGYALGHYYVFGTQQPGRTDIWRAFKDTKESTFASTASKLVGRGAHAEPAREPAKPPSASDGQGDGDGVLRGGIGTPGQIAAVLRAYEDAGVDQVVFLTQAGRTRHDHICESLELFAREVMPEFAERDGARVGAKAQRLADATAKALARKAPPRVLDPDYAFNAAGKL